MQFWRSATLTVPLGDLSASAFLALAALAMEDLSWEYQLDKQDRLCGLAHLGLFSAGERLSLEVDAPAGQVTITCRQPYWRLLKADRLHGNLQQLVEYMGHNRKLYDDAQLEEKYKGIYQLPEEPDAMGRIVRAPLFPFATVSLVMLCTLYFLAFSIQTGSFLHPDMMDVFRWGGNIRLHTLGGQGWRLLSSCLLHIGVWHLLGNMFVLALIGRLCEPVIGPVRMLLVFFATGIIGSLVSVIFSGARLSAGASGAIFGLYGVFLALLTTRLLREDSRKVLFQSVFVFVAYGLFTGMSQGVDNAAHLGGLTSGLLFGYIIFFTWQHKYDNLLSVIAIIAITVIVTGAGLWYYRNDTVRYERMLNRMRQLERETVLPGKEHTKELVHTLITVNRPAWQAFVRTIDSAAGFRFGSNSIYTEQKHLLARYGRLRLAQNEIWIRDAGSQDPTYREMDSIRIKVSEVYDSLIALSRRPLRLQQ